MCGGGEPIDTIVSIGKKSPDVEVIKIYQSKRVMIRLNGKLAIAKPGEAFRYLNDPSNISVVDQIVLKSVDFDTGKMIFSGIWRLY